MLGFFYKGRNQGIAPWGQHWYPPSPLVLGLFPQQSPGKAVLSLSPDDKHYALQQFWSHGATLGLVNHLAQVQRWNLGQGKGARCDPNVTTLCPEPVPRPPAVCLLFGGLQVCSLSLHGGI